MRLNPKPLPLSEKLVRDFQAQLDAFIDAKAAEVAKDSPGVPLLVCRGLLTARAVGCPCRQYLEITKGGAA